MQGTECPLCVVTNFSRETQHAKRSWSGCCEEAEVHWKDMSMLQRLYFAGNCAFASGKIVITDELIKVACSNAEAGESQEEWDMTFHELTNRLRSSTIVRTSSSVRLMTFDEGSQLRSDRDADNGQSPPPSSC